MYLLVNTGTHTDGIVKFLGADKNHHVHTTNHEVPFDVVSHDPEEDARREHNGFGIEIRLAGNVIFQILPLLLTEQFFSLLKGGTVKHWDIICRT